MPLFCRAGERYSKGVPAPNLTIHSSRQKTRPMHVLRTRQRRAFPVAIMLIAALAVVWHGAMALIAHPLTVSGHTEMAVVSGHDGHVHAHAAGALGQHAHHEHGKSKSGDDCCSTVSAVTLPVLASAEVTLVTVRLVRRLGSEAGNGLEPSTPTEPPSTAYQC